MMYLHKVININEISDGYRLWTTKEFFSYASAKFKFLDTEVWEYTELIENIKKGKVAIFSVSKNTRMEEVINTSKLGLQVYVVPHKEYRKLRESYVLDCVEVHKK